MIIRVFVCKYIKLHKGFPTCYEVLCMPFNLEFESTIYWFDTYLRRMVVLLLWLYFVRHESMSSYINIQLCLLCCRFSAQNVALRILLLIMISFFVMVPVKEDFISSAWSHPS